MRQVISREIDLDTLYAARVSALEEQGLCTSDAQAVADLEFQRIQEGLAKMKEATCESQGK